MRITVRAKNVNISMPVPLAMVGFAIRALPEAVFQDLRKKAPPACGVLINKDAVCFLWQECRDSLQGFEGLELIHIESEDGMFVSIRL